MHRDWKCVILGDVEFSEDLTWKCTLFGFALCSDASMSMGHVLGVNVTPWGDLWGDWRNPKFGDHVLVVFVGNDWVIQEVSKCLQSGTQFQTPRSEMWSLFHIAFQYPSPSMQCWLMHCFTTIWMTLSLGFSLQLHWSFKEHFMHSNLARLIQISASKISFNAAASLIIPIKQHLWNTFISLVLYRPIVWLG